MPEVRASITKHLSPFCFHSNNLAALFIRLGIIAAGRLCIETGRGTIRNLAGLDCVETTVYKSQSGRGSNFGTNLRSTQCAK